MSSGPSSFPRVLAIATAAAVMLAAVLWLGGKVAGRDPVPDHPPAAFLAPPDPPIPAEAGVFATSLSELAVPSNAERRAAAHPRTLAMYRSVRAYPGAPPRIPHSLTEEEFRTGSCSGCHERGGYAARYRLYAPVTPHPELRTCLQCHAVDEALVGLAPPATADDTCRQCHRMDAPDRAFVATAWRTPVWAGLSRPAMEGSPQPIPHDLQMRGNCVACHAGPAAVAEIRTDHPERSNCRQCHVPAAPEGVFVRP